MHKDGLPPLGMDKDNSLNLDFSVFNELYTYM